MKLYRYMFLLFGIVKYTHTQIFSIGSNQKVSKTACDTSAKSSLVEHFFNIVFTEFHDTPPVCVCVQMCPEQPTYCYPNGCLKRADKRDEDVRPPVTHTKEITRPVFFIDEKDDFINDFLAKNYIDDSKPSTIPVKAEIMPDMIMRPDPFKDRYKILFKYKKMPKVELKFNLNEQVKNIKTGILKAENPDVSKTRWPMNKIDRRLGGQQIMNKEPHVQKGTTNPRYFMTMFPDKEIVSYPPKYFKRELANEDDEIDIKAIYVVGKSDKESSPFSIEKLIDSLIERSFDNTSMTPDLSVETKTMSSATTEDPNTNEPKENSTKHSMNDTTTNIISMNLTNENIDKNKYADDNITDNKMHTVSEMIATLAKRIDVQNNTSLEMIRRIAGDFEFETIITSTERSMEPTLNTYTEAPTTENTSHPIEYESKTTKKSRQRYIKRFQHSKNT